LYALIPPFLVSMAVACFSQIGRNDLVFANWSISGVVAGVIARLLGKPVVTTLRGTDVNASPSAILLRMILGLCLRLSHKVVLVGEGMRDNLAARYPQFSGKLVMIPNGVAEELFMLPIVQRTNDQDRNPVTVTVVASLVPMKGIDVLLRALAFHRGRHRLHVLGDGPDRARLEALASELSLAVTTTFVGQVAPERVKDYLGSADIFVLPSYAEGRPNALLEAMAAGRAVVATEIDGVTELVSSGANGLLVPAGSVESLAAALGRLIDDASLRRSLGDAARKSLLDKGLSWSRTAEQYSELFRALFTDHQA
jgi:glycosyltransferase involved in cell wall biosynthesis